MIEIRETEPPARRWQDNISTGILVGVLVAMAIGYLHAQVSGLAPPVAEAVLEGQITTMGVRVSHLETMQNYALAAMVANLVAHLFQIQRASGRRSSGG